MAGIYIHVPFCKTRCIYCDFYSTTGSELTERYVQAICKELEMRRDYLQGEPVQTIYFGGGTPSQLAAHDFDRIFETIGRVYSMDACCEITLEANPDDLTPEYLQSLAALPFNRISIGIQTFNDRILKLLRRRHTAAQAVEAVSNCRKAGFANISIDLMYGLPDETMEDWQHDLDMAISLHPEHISAYHLIYEKDTPLYTMLTKNTVAEADEDSSNRFFAALIDGLSGAGYQHYEISNFSLPGRESMHNSAYWDGTHYLGCGPSAHSYNGHIRQWNIASLSLYIIGIEEGKPNTESEELDTTTRYNDTIITSIRTSKGLSLPMLEQEFGRDLAAYCRRMAARHLESGNLEIKDGFLRLTREGIFISDGIMSDLLWVED